MDLWIRNQDGDILTRVQKLYVTRTPNEIGYGIYDIHYDDLDDCDVYLGVYKERGRALEVLDEIEDRITLLNLMSTINGEKEMIKIAHAFGEDKINGVLKPYQMPKE